MKLRNFLKGTLTGCLGATYSLFTLFFAVLFVMPGKAVSHEIEDENYVFIKTEGGGFEETPAYILSDNKTVFWGGCRFFHLDSMSFSKKCDLIGTPVSAVASSKRNRLLVTATIPRKSGNKEDYISYLYDLPSKKILYKWPNRKFIARRFRQVALNPDGNLIAYSELLAPGTPGARDSFIYLFDSQLNLLSRVFEEGSESMSFSEDGSKLTTIGSTVNHIYCLNNNKLKKCGDEKYVIGYFEYKNYSPNKRYYASWNEKGGFNVGGTFTYFPRSKIYSEPFRFIIDATTQLNSFDFSRDSKWIVAKVTQVENNEDGIVVGKLPPANPPSFDCVKATGQIERLICSSKTLSQLDFDLAKNFEILRAATQGENRVRLLAEQRAWIKESRNCEDDKCLTAAYTQRMEALCKDYPAEKQLVCASPSKKDN